MQIPVWEGRAQTRGEEEEKGEREHGRIDGKKTKAVRRQTRQGKNPAWLLTLLCALAPPFPGVSLCLAESHLMNYPSQLIHNIFISVWLNLIQGILQSLWLHLSHQSTIVFHDYIGKRPVGFSFELQKAISRFSIFASTPLPPLSLFSSYPSPSFFPSLIDKRAQSVAQKHVKWPIENVMQIECHAHTNTHIHRYSGTQAHTHTERPHATKKLTS